MLSLNAQPSEHSEILSKNAVLNARLAENKIAGHSLIGYKTALLECCAETNQPTEHS
jgi:hypothetical protein